MKQFAILASIPMLVVNVNPRREKHGKARVAAVDVRVRVTLPNFALDQLRPNAELRHALFKKEGATPSEDQPGLPGVDLISDTPVVRVSGMSPMHIEDDLSGYTVTFDLGTGRKESVVELSSAKLNAFSIEPLAGGSVNVEFRIQAAHLSEREYGKLCMLIDTSIAMKLDPPIEDAQASIEAAKAEVEAEAEAPAPRPKPSRNGRAINAHARKAAAKKAAKK